MGDPVPFPFRAAAGRIEFLVELLKPFPPTVQKQIIMRARHPWVGGISDAEAELLIAEMGLVSS